MSDSHRRSPSKRGQSKSKRSHSQGPSRRSNPSNPPSPQRSRTTANHDKSASRKSRKKHTSHGTSRHGTRSRSHGHKSSSHHRGSRDHIESKSSDHHKPAHAHRSTHGRSTSHGKRRSKKRGSSRSDLVKAFANCFSRKKKHRKHKKKPHHGHHDRHGHQDPENRHWLNRISGGRLHKHNSKDSRASITSDDSRGSSSSRDGKSRRKSRSSIKSQSPKQDWHHPPSETGSSDSRKVKFNESVKVQEIPNKDHPGRDHRIGSHPILVFQPGQDPNELSVTESPDSQNVSGSMQQSGQSDVSDQDIHIEESFVDSGEEKQQGEGHHHHHHHHWEPMEVYPAGNLAACNPSDLPPVDSCSVRSVKSVKSILLDESEHPFDESKCYCRADLLNIMETLVLGINNRESIKSRYDEEFNRLSVHQEYQNDKLTEVKAELESAQMKFSQMDLEAKVSADKLTENFIQLTRERKRLAGAVDLRDDFDKYLQIQISTKSKYVQDYAQILSRLEALVDDSALQWVQRETMMSTESEALERMHNSVEKEHKALQLELDKHEALYASRAAQNSKLSQVVEKELEKYAKKQQDILRFNEKRIRALEGCIRTMQLDREVMYGEIAENRYRLKEVVQSRICALMDKIQQYRGFVRAICDEIASLARQSEALISVSPALQSYTKIVITFDLIEMECKINQAKAACDKIVLIWNAKHSQKTDLTEIRKTFVDNQRRHMLNSEEEYFLMEPVEVPGTDSHTNFQRSMDDFGDQESLPTFGCGAYSANAAGEGSVTAPTAHFQLHKSFSPPVGFSISPKEKNQVVTPQETVLADFENDLVAQSQSTVKPPSHYALTQSHYTGKSPRNSMKEESPGEGVVEDVDHLQLLQQNYKEELYGKAFATSRRKIGVNSISMSKGSVVGNAFRRLSTGLSRNRP